MALINSHILRIAHNDVQTEIDKRIKIFLTLHPQASLVYLDGSDSVLPIVPSAAQALRQAVGEMNTIACNAPPIKGYQFLLNAIVRNDFKDRGIKIKGSEIFVNAGAKQDIAGISDILCKDNRLAMMDPVSQIYVKSNVIGYRAGVMEGSQWSNVVYLPAEVRHDCVPVIPDERFDVVFLSSPCNPTGMAFSRDALTAWVDYALANDVVILFDATYEAFIGDADIPRSIYEIKNAAKCAIEFHSFAKNGGFAGLHCGYTVIPQELSAYSLSYEKQVTLNDLWQQRLMVKHSAPSYLVQRAAAALYSPQGKAECAANVEYYMFNAALLRQALEDAHLQYCGGDNSPYLWVQAPAGDAWKLFDILLYKCGIVSVPGEMFGGNPDNCVRISAMAGRREVVAACEAISKM